MEPPGQEALDASMPLMQFTDDMLQLYPDQSLGHTPPDNGSQEQNEERLWPANTMGPSQVYSQALTRVEPNQASEQVIEMPLAQALQDHSSVLVEYYFKEVCGMMSCYDSPMNPYRTTISNMWSGSQSLYYITQSMAAACLSEVSPTFASVGHRLRDQAMICLSREAKIAELETSSLLALVMLGMSLSWHDPDSLGQPQFDVLARKVMSAEARGDPLALADKKKEFFFYNSLVYWKMLLSFVTDMDPNMRSAQPQPIPPDSLDKHEPRMPHPQTGIGIEVQELVASVGSLVRKERKRLRTRRFVSKDDIQQAQDAIITSERLHAELCTIELPQEGDIVDAGDDLTPAIHLVNIAEAYRCTGLLQLYRNFPDLLVPFAQSAHYMTGSPDSSVGIFWFGWTGFTDDIHWIVPTLSGIFTGFGLMSIFLQALNYLVDAYLMFAASAIAGNTFLRSLCGAGFPLFARQMFDGMGIQYASTLLGCVAVVLAPIPFIFYRYGAKIRQRSKYAPTAPPPASGSSGEDEKETDNETALAAVVARRDSLTSATNKESA
jgi:hypothetical protein